VVAVFAFLLPRVFRSRLLALVVALVALLVLSWVFGPEVGDNAFAGTVAEQSVKVSGQVAALKEVEHDEIEAFEHGPVVSGPLFKSAEEKFAAAAGASTGATKDLYEADAKWMAALHAESAGLGYDVEARINGSEGDLRAAEAHNLRLGNESGGQPVECVKGCTTSGGSSEVSFDGSAQAQIDGDTEALETPMWVLIGFVGGVFIIFLFVLEFRSGKP
jgi:hypothetical protein